MRKEKEFNYYEYVNYYGNRMFAIAAVDAMPVNYHSILFTGSYQDCMDRLDPPGLEGSIEDKQKRLAYRKGSSYIQAMIEELLEKQNTLSDIAAELYGDFWIMNEKFWGSPTERELQQVTNRLIELGFTVNPTPEQEEAAKIISKKFNLGLDLED
jgi:hypothetical protein